MMTRVTMTRPEQFRAGELLKAGLIKGDDGLYHYRDGQSDATIAAEINPALNAGHIARLREDVFGKLRMIKAPGGVPPMVTSDPRVDTLIVRFNTLCDALGEDSGFTFAHLKIDP